ncbi:MAG: hypothetical protein BECKG1743D_GA0114223_105383 [Candidatus Kentron sp. G]|nr:MAG: hypothetical protein BECKG1743F_GA0114225_106053 [Candidatus Kentron sp. G]VFN03423.1 MAG: hypothetical protein BECKG1743E_GA0114224_106153 [Candidatus Kentron sp. G]VFN04017.1 MAG: hypothetical protein BECKG1743D_GA0114223_105383 [Candidatus Kentron sp. G]
MPRTADYTIQGFLYQFNKTALEILKAQDDDTITVEGVIEDIDVDSSASLTVIQCKYHETSRKFTPSAIYKPLLQMMAHFSEYSGKNIRYVLFAHFPDIGTPPPAIGKQEFEDARASKDRELQKHIEALLSDIDLDAFDAKFTIEFGPKYDEIVEQVGQALETNGIPKGDIETLVYPNTIHKIATLSTKHDAAGRRITKKQFLSELQRIRRTAISRWTLALKTRKKLLNVRRKQLKGHLDKNVRLRYFIVDPTGIENYDTEIILFIKDLIDFLALRLTNNADQNYVRRLFPDNSSGITEILPNLAPGECVVVGDAVLLPAVVQMPFPKPEPHSQSVSVHQVLRPALFGKD